VSLSNGERLDVDLVARRLVVESEPGALVADLH
jgi:hypothetical protein